MIHIHAETHNTSAVRPSEMNIFGFEGTDICSGTRDQGREKRLGLQNVLFVKNLFGRAGYYNTDRRGPIACWKCVGG